MSCTLAPQSYSDNNSRIHYCFYVNHIAILYGFFSFIEEKFYVVRVPGKNYLSRENSDRFFDWLSKYDYELSKKSMKRYFHTDAYWYIEWLKDHAVFNYNKIR